MSEEPTLEEVAQARAAVPEVPKNASSTEIGRIRRRFARELHPDVVGNNARFDEVMKATGVLIKHTASQDVELEEKQQSEHVRYAQPPQKGDGVMTDGPVTEPVQASEGFFTGIPRTGATGSRSRRGPSAGASSSPALAFIEAFAKVHAASITEKAPKLKLDAQLARWVEAVATIAAKESPLSTQLFASAVITNTPDVQKAIREKFMNTELFNQFAKAVEGTRLGGLSSDTTREALADVVLGRTAEMFGEEYYGELTHDNSRDELRKLHDFAGKAQDTALEIQPMLAEGPNLQRSGLVMSM